MIYICFTHLGDSDTVQSETWFDKSLIYVSLILGDSDTCTVQSETWLDKSFFIDVSLTLVIPIYLLFY